MNTHRLSPGFTLVELIVAMAILLAIGVIAFPVIARATEYGRRTTCKSNLHQIGLGIAMYRTDYDGAEAVKGVRMSHSQLGLPYHFSMNTLMKTYFRGQAIEFCPSFKGDRSHLGSTYNWGVFDTEYTDPSEDYEGLAALRGPDYPLVSCDAHNDLPWIRSLHRTTDVEFLHVLRIDGRVSERRLTMSEDNGGLRSY